MRFGASLDAVDDQGRSALHWASVCGRVGCVQLLIELRANVHLKDNEGAHPIHFTAKQVRLCPCPF